MFSKKILLLANTFRQPFLSRSFRNVKINSVKNLKKDDVKGNPGSNRLLKMVLDGESLDKTNVTMEDIEDGEEDLLDSHLLYDQHKKEISKQREFKSFQNIKRKYFKNNTCTPNFLTYFEKQQIKTLHEKSPQEWTPETLSTCFPASPEIIVKILKSKWIANEGQQILRHDKHVQDNWERFRNGDIELPIELKNHLKKFSDRRPTLITLKQAEAYIPKPATEYLKPEEFGQIITSYRGEPSNQNEQMQIEAEENYEKIYENDIRTSTKNKHFTLDQLKKNSQERSFSWYTPQPTNEKNIDVATVEASLQEHTSIISRKDVSKFIDTINNYPLAIRIPKKVWKEGYTYKVKDCFYDDRGEFLYRVPGLMTDEDKPHNQ
ncbi:uncharacterized protein LOC112684319 [Sipha flava]|uniref:Uncharacterized protein LOC112684319 n=1 Tax=Sipha flava TaxID=143950 RepID=A0A8B8FLQ4_9HEMI|nr:uncharacterized protein LOC112684319 [Sipha flava]